jgi:hypothetical protein
MIWAVNRQHSISYPCLVKHPDEYPRFRDCFITEGGNIAVYTRVGGGNRNEGYGEEELYKMEGFLCTYDDDYDNTYATYEFAVPEKWKSDFDKIVNGKIAEVSDAYKEEIKRV